GCQGSVDNGDSEEQAALRRRHGNNGGGSPDMATSPTPPPDMATKPDLATPPPPPPPPPPTGTRLGVNIHSPAGGTTNNQKPAALLGSRNMPNARMAFFPDSNLTEFRDQVTRLIAKGGRVEVSLQNSYQWNNSCPQNYPAVEADSYNQT